MRILLAALLGGVLNFAWGAISHMVLPLGHTGLDSIREEAVFVGAVRATIPEPGLYVFPWMEEPPDATAEQKKKIEEEWTAKYRQGPSGMLVVDPRGKEPMLPRQLVGELAIDVVGAFFAALLLRRSGGGVGYGLVFCGTLGAFASVAVDLPHWNWYGFPTDFTVAALIDQTVGWAVAGLGIGAILRRRVA